jgi:hypothetical protein
MPFLFGATVAERAADVEKRATRGRNRRGAVDGSAPASMESWAKLRRHIDGGMMGT